MEAYRVGINLIFSTDGFEKLALLSRHLLGLEERVASATKKFTGLKVAALGAVTAMAGFETLKGLWHITEGAERLNHEMAKLQIGARLSGEQTTAYMKDAFRIAQEAPGTEVPEIIKQRRELFGVFGNMGAVDKTLGLVAKGSRATSAYVDKETDLAQIAIRALELRGHITKDHKVNPEEFASEFNAMVRSIIASEGMVDPQKLFMFIRQAGPAARNMSAEQMWGMAPAIMNALGAGPAGTAVMSLFQQMVGHVVAGKRVATAMESAGWLTPGKWQVERGGHVTMDQNAVPDQAGFMEHPFTWLHEHLEEMKTKKDSTGKPIDLTGLVQDIFQLASRQTSARLINDIEANWAVISNEEKRWARMPDVNAVAKEQIQTDLKVNVENFTAAWKNLIAALGQEGIPVAINILHSMTDAVNYVTKWAIENEPTVRKIMGAVAGLGVAMAVVGTAAAIAGMVMFLPGGLATLAVTSVIGVLGGLAMSLKKEDWKKLWDGVLGGVQYAANAIKSAGEYLMTQAQVVGAALKMFLDKLLEPLRFLGILSRPADQHTGPHKLDEKTGVPLGFMGGSALRFGFGIAKQAADGVSDAVTKAFNDNFDKSILGSVSGVVPFKPDPTHAPVLPGKRSDGTPEAPVATGKDVSPGGPKGTSPQKQSYAPPAANSNSVQPVYVTNMLTGAAIASGVTDYQVNSMRRRLPGGTTGADLRAQPERP